MNLRRLAAPRTLAIGAVVLAVTLGAGVAVAATSEVFDPKEEQEAFQDAVAEKLGVTPAELEQAYMEAALERLDAAVTAGRISEEQAAAIRERIESGDFFGPLTFGFGPELKVHGGPGKFFDAAAAYLDMTEAELHERLASGKSLADVAEAEGKSVTGLKQAILDDAKEKLDQMVEDGQLTQARADAKLDAFESAIDDLVNTKGPGPFPLGSRPFGFGFGPGFGLDLRVDGGPHASVRLESAAKYLGLTEAELQQRLRDGQSLAEIARAEGKSVEGLEQAMLAPAKEKLANAVEKGVITSAQRDEMLERLAATVDDLVNRSGPPEPGPLFGHPFDGSMFERFGSPMDRARPPPDA